MVRHGDEAIRESLLVRRADLMDRLARATTDALHRAVPLDPDFSEQAVQTENDPVLAAIANGAKAEIDELDAALARLDNGLYRICIRCGKEIEPARLSIAVYATRCSKCAAAEG